MADIKFRAWDDLNKRMTYDFFFVDSDGDIWYDQNPHGVDMSGMRKIAPTGRLHLMQYACFEDKEGKAIYEGDVIKFHYFYGALGEGLGFQECEHELIGVVKWRRFGWGLDAIKGEHWKGYTGYEDGEGNSSFMDLMAMNESGLHEESFEIIGNIYENPDLIPQT